LGGITGNFIAIKTNELWRVELPAAKVSKLRDEAAIWKQQATIVAMWLNKKQNKQLILLRRKYCKKLFNW
jgi:hypothetical protein